MEELIASIEKSLDSKNWYAALAVALILPDICGKNDNPKKSSSERYKLWFDTYVKRCYMIQESIGSASISGGDCYAIRCALLHEFSEDLSSHKARQILAKYKFCSPNANFSYSFKIKESGCEIAIRVDEFCNNICMGVRKWIEESKSKMSENQQFVKIHE
ncbi:hypothetical protein [Pelosinus sp. IPA-1]|uniref:hypothetical protein n=1 Tax=Pelosinus sp. IPA-1 TaxID=3029569 RepID=UPI002436162D|nr:hypothetical protein [Pelosinus sp. IPA-1]GMB00457.1 hypothetical protein PIPA1_32560 [Pelosinus sp. IPA-1]